MKIRQGFVSNSSSSSYIVVFTPNAVKQFDIINHITNSYNISNVNHRIKNMEEDLKWHYEWCKKNGHDYDKNGHVIKTKKLISDLKQIEDRALYLQVEYGECEYAVIDLLNLLKSIGFVEDYKNED